MTDMNINPKSGVDKISQLAHTPTNENSKKADVEISIFGAIKELENFKNESKKAFTKANIMKLASEGANVVKGEIEKITGMLGELKDVAFKEIKKAAIDQIEKETNEVVKELKNKTVEKETNEVVKELKNKTVEKEVNTNKE